MQSTILNFSNSFYSKRFALKILGLCVAIVFISIVFSICIYACNQCIQGESIRAFSMIHDGIPHACSWWVILILTFFPYNISMYQNQYQVHEGKLFVKEYCFFIQVLDTVIPLDKIAKSTLINKDFLSLRSSKLVLTIDGKDYVLRAQNHAKELNQFINNYISEQ